MKTPLGIVNREITSYIGDSDTSDGFDIGDMLSFAIAAIEADRAQRTGRLDDLHAYDHDLREEGDIPDPADKALIVQIDTPANIGRIRVYINDGRIYDGDPETGDEWSLT